MDARTVNAGAGVPPPAVIDRTSPTDLMQFASDLPESPMQVAAVLVLGNATALDLTAVRDAIGQRIQVVPRLRQRLVRTPFGSGRPVWVDDPNFDLRNHVDAVSCPESDDEDALLDVVADTVARRLPMSRPVWSATLVTSLRGGGAALIVLLHTSWPTASGDWLSSPPWSTGHPPHRTPASHARRPVTVPISARRQVSRGHLGNQVGVMTVPVTLAGDPYQRLAAIAHTTRIRRPAALATSTALLGPAFRILAWAGAFRWFIERQRLVTTMVTNLRGPDGRMSFLGAPIIDVIPVSPITGNVTVAFAVLSYAGTLVVTAIADSRRCPDLPLLRARLQSELDLLTTDQQQNLSSPAPYSP